MTRFTSVIISLALLFAYSSFSGIELAYKVFGSLSIAYYLLSTPILLIGSILTKYAVYVSDEEPVSLEKFKTQKYRNYVFAVKWATGLLYIISFSQISWIAASILFAILSIIDTMSIALLCGSVRVQEAQKNSDRLLKHLRGEDDIQLVERSEDSFDF